MKRAWVVLLLLTAVAVPLVALDADPAAACSCRAVTDRVQFANADAVFVGEVRDYEAPQELVTSADPAVWTFRVREVLKGDVARIQPVVSEFSGASCGLEIPKRGEFVVFAMHPGPEAPGWVGDGELYAGLCGGTRAATISLEGVPVARAPTPPVATTVAPVDEDDGVPTWLVTVVVAAAVVAIGAGTLFALRRRSRVQPTDS